MAYKPMWNFGGVRIAGVDGGADISFDTDEAMGQIEFDEVTAGSFVTNNGTIYKRTLGSRANIKMTIVNMKDGTADKISNLFSYFNIARTSAYALSSGRDEPIGVYPRFNTDYAVEENLKFDCYLSYSVSAPDTAKLNIGQIINLEFTGADVINLPTESLPVYVLWQVNDAGTIRTLQFNNDGTIENAKFKTE